MILVLRTDKPEAEIGLYDGTIQKNYKTWTAHRKLAETLHTEIRDILVGQKLDWKDISGIAVYQGPGSFTGLRIGLTVANTLASSLNIPIVGIEGEDWLQKALEKLAAGQDDSLVIPVYGQPVHITPPKK